MDIIEEIKAKLLKYPDIRFESIGNQITIFPKSDKGFVVGLLIDDCYDVSFGGWHEEFNEPEEALDCIAFGLSSECRLKVHSRGDFDHKWTLEYKDADDRWKEESSTGLIFFPFWRSKKERYLQNDLIT